MAQSSAPSPDPFIGRNINELKKTGVPVEDFNPIGMNIRDIHARGAVIEDEHKRPIGATGSWEPLWPSRDTGPSISNLLPTMRDMPAAVGGAIGGAIGAGVLGPPTAGIGVAPGLIAGTGAGASIGESLYQLGQHLTGSPEAPQSGIESLARQIPPLMMGPLESIPFLARYAAEHPVLPAMRNTVIRSIKRTPQTLITRGLDPSDKYFQDHVEQGLSELKEAEKVIGPIRNVPKAQVGLDRQSQTYNALIKEQIVNPQATVKVPGSRDALVEAQTKAIPEDVRMNDPEKYTRLVKKIESRLDDYTIGELNHMRSELGNRDSLYFGKDLSGQLTMDASDRAIEIARGNSARRLFYHGLDNAPGALGGGQQAAEINHRIGSIIHMKDALLPNVNKSVAQQRTIGTRVASGVGKLLSPVSSLKSAAKGTGRTVDQDVALALNRWNKFPEPIKINLAPRVKGLAGTPTELPFVPQDIGGIKVGAKGEYLTPEAEYLQQQRQRELWRQAQPIPEPGQQNLLTTEHGGGALAPPNLFGIKQTPYRWTPALRETSTLSDLHSMQREIQDYLRTQNPPADTRKIWVKDVADIQREIYRRQQARKVGRQQSAPE